MSESMITRCPKCSTTFRVTEDVLKMAKGKVRCGQCFHIFTAEAIAETPKSKTNKPAPAKTAQAPNRPIPTPKQNNTDTISDDGTVNPEWLNTLFNESDLEPYTPPIQKEAPATSAQPQPKATVSKAAISNATFPETNKPETSAAMEEDLAPWELELAEIEEQLTSSSPAKAPVFGESLADSTQKPATEQLSASKSNDEPDYMQALHSLAQDISKQDSLTESEYASKESIKQLAAEYSLASLTDAEEETKKHNGRWGWLWGTGILLAFAALAAQLSVTFFEQGSRSPEFRSVYRVACSYLGCTLPPFEDISAVSVEHVRVQSHPTEANTLQVNAIMTNTSKFSQPMPKLALEFYDLNGKPVAARLFAPQNYLHRDFLDITYMPPNTPIHIVIPIQDPGARAVTHQIKAYSSTTRSY